MVYKYWTNGTYTDDSFSLTSENGASIGITEYNNFFWIVDKIDDEVYKYWVNGTYTEKSWDTAGSLNEQPEGITILNDSFYIITQWRDEVYEYETGFVTFNFNDLAFADGDHNWTVESFDTVDTLGTTDTWNFSIS